jgi:phosphomethylpyrimidine synthase
MPSLNPALHRVLRDNLQELARQEALSPSEITSRIEEGRMVLLANPGHEDCRPCLIGQPARLKVNANIGTSPFLEDPELESAKLRAAEKAGAHTVMDLSTGGELNAMRERMLRETALPLGTVPLYSVAQKYILNRQDPASWSSSEILEEIARQAEQGVDFMTLHCGVTRRAVALAREGSRRLGVVSRGGSLLARWMEHNDAENPLLTKYDQLLRICGEHNVVLSLGDGLRPGAIEDAGDDAQWEEVITLAGLARRARESGAQAMIEGPGHVPLHLIQSQIQGIKALCRGAPLYVLGPLPTDIAAGHDHIAGTVGACLAAYYGADFLCYLTPAEHLTLPNENDVWQGVKASLIAAHSAELSLGREEAIQRNQRVAQARAELDWSAMAEHCLDSRLVRKRREGFASREECAMCGEFCAVKLFS